MAEKTITEWVDKFNSMKEADQKKALRTLFKDKKGWMKEDTVAALTLLKSSLKEEKADSTAKTESKTTKRTEPKSPPPMKMTSPKSPKSTSGQPSIFDKLTDTSLYTGSHKERFDSDGKGRGLAGRDRVAKGNGYIHGGGDVISKMPTRTQTSPPPKI
eukprot:TRINITY_DN5606_c0_g1_i2.p1 TRINITY_DN5606_c0_g1~~TRINITY_DN5606_c0_g1_i2.p1  ORF type:complete len:181 (+),score=52.99 TRINITY_DN5606_c0_g1_i2:70-543(+)